MRGTAVPKYVVMFPADNEVEMDARSEAQRQAVFNTDFEFGQLLATRGGTVVGGAGLTRSTHARTIRRGPEANPVVAEGPWRPRRQLGRAVAHHESADFAERRTLACREGRARDRGGSDGQHTSRTCSASRCRRGQPRTVARSPRVQRLRIRDHRHHGAAHQRAVLRRPPARDRADPRRRCRRRNRRSRRGGAPATTVAVPDVRARGHPSSRTRKRAARP
jgi:hypothetical protein